MNAPAPLPETPAAAPVRKRRSRWWTVRGSLPPRTAGLLTALGLIAPFFIWWLYTAMGLNDPLFMPGPIAVAERTWNWWLEDGLWGDAGALDRLYPLYASGRFYPAGHAVGRDW